MVKLVVRVYTYNCEARLTHRRAHDDAEEMC